MGLLRYFDTNDGSLPELVVTFGDPTEVVRAFELLFALGARDATVNGGCVWIRASQSERPFAGSSDAALVVSGVLEPFHVVLAGITCSDQVIPDLGVFVDPESLELNYRMGPEWGNHQIDSLLALLRQLSGLGGMISVPWWGADGERAFLDALGNT